MSVVQLAERVERAVVGIRKTKEWATRKGRADIAAQIEVYRGDQMVALLTVNGLSADILGKLGGLSAHAFDADTLVLSFETYGTVTDPELVQRAAAGDEEAHAALMRNPVTGRPYEYVGQIREVAEEHDGIAKGWVTEMITVVAVNRAGDMDIRNLPFHYASNGRYLMWDHVAAAEKWWRDQRDKGEGETSVRGGLADALITGMNIPSMGQILPDPQNTEMSRAERDAWAAEFIQRARLAAVILCSPEDNGDRVRTLKRAGMRDMRG